MWIFDTPGWCSTSLRSIKHVKGMRIFAVKSFSQSTSPAYFCRSIQYVDAMHGQHATKYYGNTSQKWQQIMETIWKWVIGCMRNGHWVSSEHYVCIVSALLYASREIKDVPHLSGSERTKMRRCTWYHSYKWTFWSSCKLFLQINFVIFSVTISLPLEQTLTLRLAISWIMLM